MTKQSSSKEMIMDFLSGDLDRMFTVLYEMGKVEPLLTRDWKKLYTESRHRWNEVSRAIKKLNALTNLRDMRLFLETLPSEILDALVVEVARELADFQGRDESLH
jgi:hypothetical protein